MREQTKGELIEQLISCKIELVDLEKDLKKTSKGFNWWNRKERWHEIDSLLYQIRWRKEKIKEIIDKI